MQPLILQKIFFIAYEEMNKLFYADCEPSKFVNLLEKGTLLDSEVLFDLYSSETIEMDLNLREIISFCTTSDFLYMIVSSVDKKLYLLRYRINSECNIKEYPPDIVDVKCDGFSFEHCYQCDCKIVVSENGKTKNDLVCMYISNSGQIGFGYIVNKNTLVLKPSQKLQSYFKNMICAEV